MKYILRILVLAGAAAAAAFPQTEAPKHEIGLTLGSLLGAQRDSNLTHLKLGAGTALSANYGYRFLGAGPVALYGEVHLLANPLRTVTSTDTSLTRDAAALYVTPGVRLKLFPGSGIAPWVAVGGGFADYEQSMMTLSGATNAAPRHVNHGAVDFGGGVDFKFWRFVGLRAEVRDFFTGSPAFNAASIRGGQHNVVAGGGLVLKFH